MIVMNKVVELFKRVRNALGPNVIGRCELQHCP
jgi:hypothetical protein